MDVVAASREYIGNRYQRHRHRGRARPAPPARPRATPATVSASPTRWRPCVEAGPPPPPPRRAARGPHLGGGRRPLRPAPGTGARTGRPTRAILVPAVVGPPPVAPPLKPRPSDRDDKHHRGRRPPPHPLPAASTASSSASRASPPSPPRPRPRSSPSLAALEPRHAFRAYLLARDINDVRVLWTSSPSTNSTARLSSRACTARPFIVAGAPLDSQRAAMVGPEGNAYLRRRRRRRGFRGTAADGLFADFVPGWRKRRRRSARFWTSLIIETVAPSGCSVSRRGGHPRGALGRRAALRFRVFGP